MTIRTIADVIGSAIPALADLRDKIVAQIERLKDLQAKYPDLTAQFQAGIDELEAELGKLDAVASPDALANLSITAVQELIGLPKTGLRPTSHAGDVTGG